MRSCARSKQVLCLNCILQQPRWIKLFFTRYFLRTWGRKNWLFGSKNEYLPLGQRKKSPTRASWACWPRSRKRTLKSALRRIITNTIYLVRARASYVRRGVCVLALESASADWVTGRASGTEWAPERQCPKPAPGDAFYPFAAAPKIFRTADYTTSQTSSSLGQ